jgi:hypothetical protein
LNLNYDYVLTFEIKTLVLKVTKRKNKTFSKSNLKAFDKTVESRRENLTKIKLYRIILEVE